MINGSSDRESEYGFLCGNIEDIKRRVGAAAVKSGRSAPDISIIAVSKTKPIDAVIEASKIGITCFGENRAQELLEKQRLADGLLNPDIEWHMIGSLQTNKVRQVIGRVRLIHSLDRFELAAEIQKCALKADITVDVLVQVNIANEKTKSGFPPEEVVEAVYKLSKLNNLNIKGLMAIAPFVDDPEDNRGYFSALYKIYVDITKENMDNTSMEVLSAGLSNDFEVAIEEGSNMIRIGSLLFGKRL
jgi:pyridoxal phosphate enzyme (YggS family)